MYTLIINDVEVRRLIALQTTVMCVEDGKIAIHASVLPATRYCWIARFLELKKCNALAKTEGGVTHKPYFVSSARRSLRCNAEPGGKLVVRAVTKSLMSFC